MIEQIDQDIIDEIGSPDSNAKRKTSFISEVTTAKKSISIENYKNDDLIASLSAAYENKRARQVFNWERMRINATERLT